jgi:menaquinone-dependent protoporphyrinogen IX oxidase
MRNVFRANVMNFMRKQKEAVQKKVSAALLVNLPYIHLDDYIPQFEEQIGYKCDVCMTTGGIIDMRLYRSNQGLVRYCMDNRLPDMDPSIEIFGEISTADLELFIDRIINCYKIKHIEEQ